VLATVAIGAAVGYTVGRGSARVLGGVVFAFGLVAIGVGAGSACRI